MELIKQAQHSLYDYLLNIMPELGDGNFKIIIREKSDPNASKLYNLWQDAESKLSERRFRRPPTMSETDVKALERSGFIEMQGSNMKITNKGVVAIRKMILDDDSFALAKSAASQGMRKVASVRSHSSSNWYQRLKSAN